MKVAMPSSGAIAAALTGAAGFYLMREAPQWVWGALIMIYLGLYILRSAVVDIAQPTGRMIFWMCEVLDRLRIERGIPPVD